MDYFPQCRGVTTKGLRCRNRAKYPLGEHRRKWCHCHDTPDTFPIDADTDTDSTGGYDSEDGRGGSGGRWGWNRGGGIRRGAAHTGRQADGAAGRVVPRERGQAEGRRRPHTPHRGQADNSFRAIFGDSKHEPSHGMRRDVEALQNRHRNLLRAIKLLARELSRLTSRREGRELAAQLEALALSQENVARVG